jgi:hypothetical protein
MALLKYSAALGGRDRESHLLAERSADEASQGVRLPAGGFQQFLGSGALGSLQQVEDGGRFAALAGVVLRAAWPFLLRAGFLPRLALGERGARATCASGGLFRCLGLDDFCLFRAHMCSFGGVFRDHINHSDWAGLQGDSAGRR